MTEQEWLTTNDCLELAFFARGNVDTQRFRFLAVVWGERIRHAFYDYDLPWFDAFAAWVESGGPSPRSVCEEPTFNVMEHWTGLSYSAGQCAEAIRADNPMMAAAYAGETASRQRLRASPPPDFTRTHRGRSAKKRREAEVQTRQWRDAQEGLRARAGAEFCEQFRDVAGNPFKPVTFDPSWRTSTVLTLSTQMYSSRCFNLMPVLADALMDAGAPDDSELIRHCRRPGPHCRGCHVLDLILGKN